MRWLLARQTLLGPAFLNRLVRVDERIRQTGLLKSVAQGSFRYDDCTFFFDEGNRGIAESVVTTGQYELPTTTAILETLRPGSVFIDAGANIGFFSILASRSVGVNGRVYAFEPTATTRHCLDRNKAVNSATNLVVEGFAVGDRSRRARLRVLTQGESNHLIDSAEETDADVTVDVISIDEYCSRNGIDALDLVKLDIEGQELHGLRGMSDVCRRSHNLVVILELNPGLSNLSAAGVEELFAVLEDLAFSRFTVLLEEPIEFTISDDRTFLFEIMRRHNANLLARRGSARTRAGVEPVAGS